MKGITLQLANEVNMKPMREADKAWNQGAWVQVLAEAENSSVMVGKFVRDSFEMHKGQEETSNGTLGWTLVLVQVQHRLSLPLSHRAVS